MTRAWLLPTAAAAALLCAQAAQAKPVIFSANDPVGPDETVVVLGSDLDGASVTVEDLAEGPASRRPAETLQVSPGSLKFVVPPQMKPGAWRYVVRNARGEASGELNLPVVYWLQGDAGEAAHPGGWLRILGRDIARGPGAQVELAARGRAPVRLKPAAWDLWDARFDLPPDLPAGEWRVRLSNGDGGEPGWREAGRMVLEAPKPRPTLVVDARVAGAKGDGRADDAPVISAALDAAAAAGGGTVLLPRGIYLLKEGLAVPEGVTLKGAGESLVSLAFADTPAPPPAWITLASDSALEDLSISASNHVHVISGGFPAAPGAPVGHDIAVRRVLVRASVYRGHLTPAQTAERLSAQLKISTGGGDTLRLSGRNIVVEDCDLLGSGRALYLERPVAARVARTQFWEGRYGWISISGADGVLFEDNRIEGADLQSTGGGVNTLGAQPWSRNVLIKHNILQRMLGWDAEALTTDGPGGYYYGQPEYLGPTAVRVPAAVPAGAALLVTGGTGAGAWARVAAVAAGGRLTLDRPLPVPLDASSVVAVEPYQAGYLILGNHFADAGVAVQIYGASIDEVVAGNVSERTSGFNDFGLIYHGVQPSWRTQILGNQITQSALGAPSAISVWGRQAPPSTTPLNVGAIIRGNRLLANAYIHVWGGSAATPGVSDAVVEGNKIENSDHGVTVAPEELRVLVRRNEVGP